MHILAHPDLEISAPSLHHPHLPDGDTNTEAQGQVTSDSALPWTSILGSLWTSCHYLNDDKGYTAQQTEFYPIEAHEAGGLNH